MNRTRALAGAFALVLCTAAGTAAAADSDRPVDSSQRLLQRMDRNLDGKISFEEYRNAMLRRFDDRDKNGDGVLTGDEYPKEWVAGADTAESSGKVTWAEFGEALQPTFDRFDGDHDGQLDSAEIAVFAAARQNQEAK